IVAVQSIVSRLQLLPRGESATLDACESRWHKNFAKDWASWIASNASGRNLMPLLLDAVRRKRWIRKGKVAGKDSFWTVREAIPDNGLPILALDATATPETYKEVFG